MRENFTEGLRCGNDLDEINGKPTGILRVSLGEMSSVKDVDTFVRFLRTFVDKSSGKARPEHSLNSNGSADLSLLDECGDGLGLSSVVREKGDGSPIPTVD